MEFVVEKNCYNIDAVEELTPYIKPFLDRVLSAYKIPSLDYFVVADSRDESFAETIIRYSAVVGTESYITQDGVYFVAGKSLDGIDHDGNLHQAIVIKSSIWVCAAYEYLGSQGQLKDDILKQMNTPSFMSLALILHEIGHAVDNEHQFRISGTVNTKLGYNLEYEYEEYAKYNALSLWGEYYAESFAYMAIQSDEDLTIDKQLELEKCIATYSFGIDRDVLMARVYRILYLFVIRTAFVHQSSNFSKTFNYEQFMADEALVPYVPILAKTEIAIIELYRKYPYWDSYEQLAELSEVFKEFVAFEYRRQIHSNPTHPGSAE